MLSNEGRIDMVRWASTSIQVIFTERSNRSTGVRELQRMRPPSLLPETVRDDLVRSQPGCMIVDVRHDDQLVRCRARHEIVEIGPDGGGRSDNRDRLDVLKRNSAKGHDVLFELAVRRWQRGRHAPPQAGERLAA